MPRITIPPLLSSISSPVLWRYIHLNHGFFATSTPKPVARKLFSRSDPSQPCPRPTLAHGMVFKEAHGAPDKTGEVISMVTRSQSQGRHRSRSGTVEKVREESKVGQGNGGMITRNQGRRGGSARNGVEVQNNWNEKTSGSNKRRKKVEEDREAVERDGEVEEKKKNKKKKKTLARTKSGGPKRRGSTRTYGKRGERRKRD